jgi:carbonic anhydrase
VPRFASAITCIDGRVIAPLLDWTLDRFDVDAVDVVTEPGVDASLPDLVDDLTRRLAPSIDKHGSHQVVLAGHEDCAGNPVSETRHREHLARSAEALSTALGPAVDVLPVYVHLDGTVDTLDTPAR